MWQSQSLAKWYVERHLNQINSLLRIKTLPFIHKSYFVLGSEAAHPYFRECQVHLRVRLSILLIYSPSLSPAADVFRSTRIVLCHPASLHRSTSSQRSFLLELWVSEKERERVTFLGWNVIFISAVVTIWSIYKLIVCLHSLSYNWYLYPQNDIFSAAS